MRGFRDFRDGARKGFLKRRGADRFFGGYPLGGLPFQLVQLELLVRAHGHHLDAGGHADLLAPHVAPLAELALDLERDRRAVLDQLVVLRPERIDGLRPAAAPFAGGQLDLGGDLAVQFGEPDVRRKVALDGPCDAQERVHAVKHGHDQADDPKAQRQDARDVVLVLLGPERDKRVLRGVRAPRKQ